MNKPKNRTFFCPILVSKGEKLNFAPKINELNDPYRFKAMGNNMDIKGLSVFDDKEYQQWLLHLYEEINRQRLKSVMQLNAATLQHYWWLGNDIIRKQKE